MRVTLLVFSLLLLLPESAQASDVADEVMSQLRCRSEPSPLPILLLLERDGKIRASEMIGYDSISCFRIHGGLDVAGLKLTSVCGHEESAAIRSLRPDLLWRGPGTSPGQFVSFGTEANFEAVQRWYFENIGPQLMNRAISDDYTHIGDRTEVECSSWLQQ